MAYICNYNCLCNVAIPLNYLSLQNLGCDLCLECGVIILEFKFSVLNAYLCSFSLISKMGPVLLKKLDLHCLQNIL